LRKSSTPVFLTGAGVDEEMLNMGFELAFDPATMKHAT